MDVTVGIDVYDRAVHQERPARGFASEASARHYAPEIEVEPIHMDIGVCFEPSASAASVEVRFVARGAIDGGQMLVLDGVDLREVSVRTDDGADLVSRYDNERITIRWSAPVPRGEERRFTVTYRVVSPIAGLYFGPCDVSRRGSGTFAATDHETERARYWLACVDHPSVRTTLAFRLRVPAHYTALANGAEGPVEEHEDGTKTVHWACAERCPSYLICLVVGELVRADGGTFDGKPIAFFAPTPSSVDDLTRSFGATRDMLEWITGRLGTNLPWPKYFQFALPGFGGAMENISLVSWSDAFLCDEARHSEFGWLVDAINLHEMAHTWFGDVLVCRDFAHSWLKESWATYMEAVWAEETQGDDALHLDMYYKERAYRSEADSSYARPIMTRRFDSSWDLFDRHLYPGGAWRLHMLRALLGDDVFWTGVRAYIERFAFQVVETDDFRKVMEEVSGRSLARFFDQWFSSPGYPILEIAVSKDEKAGRTTITAKQAQVDSERGIGLFDLTLDLHVQRSDGSWEAYQLEVCDERTTLVIPGAELEQLLVDRDCRVLHKQVLDPGGKALRKTVSEGPTITARLRAAANLAKRARAGDVRAIADAALAEPMWRMRVALAGIIASAKSTEALEGLIALLDAERDPPALAPLVGHVGEFRDARAVTACERLLARDVLGPMARGAALQALGRQREVAPVAELIQALASDRGWGWVGRGAASGLGAVGTREAADALFAALASPDLPLPARLESIRALGRAGSWLDRPGRRRVTEQLSDLTRDAIYDVRQAAAIGLASLGAGIPALERLIPVTAAQDVPHLRRLIQRIKASGDPTPDKKLQQRVDALEAKVRQLVEQLQALEARSGD